MHFLYPTSRVFAVDEVCERIVRELEKRGWEVPGLKVKFHCYGGYKRVDTISSPDFKLCFGRVQRQMNSHYNDTAGIQTLFIPQKELQLFEDESGPVFNIYVGKNWAVDKEWFMASSKVNTRLHGDPRRHLHYNGSASTTERITYRKTRPTYLLHNTDLGREYGLEAGDQKFFLTQNVLTEFKLWLEQNVLAHIKSQLVTEK